MSLYKKALLLLIPLLLAQMPGWITYRDRDGNVFYLDANGKMWVEGDPVLPYHRVSAGGMEFYLNQADALLKRQHKLDAIRLWKSLRYLADRDIAAHAAGAKASERINYMMTREGDRWAETDLATALVLAGVAEQTYLADHYAGIEIATPYTITVRKKRHVRRHKYTLSSFMVGVNFTPGEGKAHDAVVSVVAERVFYPFDSAEQYREFALKKAESDDFRRTVFRRSGKRIDSTFVTGNGVYAGAEFYAARGFWGFFVRGYCAPGREKELQSFMDSIRIMDSGE